MSVNLLNGKRWGRGAVAMAVAALVWPAWGMDLQQAYDAAKAQDSTVRAARAATDSARERVPQARSQLLPNVSLSVGRNYNDLNSTQPNFFGQETSTRYKYYSFNQTLQLRQPLYRKQLFSGLEQAAYVVSDAQAALEREEQNLGVRVAGAYLDALLAQDQLELILKQREVTTTQLDASRKAFAAGSGTRTDIDEALARLDMNRAQELEARQNVDVKRRQLEVLVNAPVGELARLDASQLALLPPEPSSVEAWIAMAEDSSPEIQSLKARLEAARLEVEKAEGAHYPTLDAVAQLTRSGSENVTAPRNSYDNKLVGVQLNVPLYAGGYINSTVRQALAEQVKAEELLEATRRDLAVRLHQEFRGVTEGIRKVEALALAVKSAEQLVFSNRKSYQAGSRTVVDVLNAEQQLQVTRRDLAQARYMYIISRVRLMALAGGEKEKAVAEVNAWLVKP